MKDEAAGMPIKEFNGLHSKMYSYSTDNKSLNKIEELTEDTIEDIKKCETLKEYTINKITTSKFGSVLDDSIFEEIDRCKKLKETTKDQVKKCLLFINIPMAMFIAKMLPSGMPMAINNHKALKSCMEYRQA